jgi:hypothetical protein
MSIGVSVFVVLLSVLDSTFSFTSLPSTKILKPSALPEPS